ncbi:hypothetical protein PFISCL1PPCAC_7606, partial [Pristionchus fissidentatus]
FFQMVLTRLFLLFLSCFFITTQSRVLIDCLHGFTGEIEASVQSGYLPTNDTRMCAAEWCMKVIVHSAIDNDGFMRRGVSSRCAYTGGDRQLCYSAHERGGDDACTQVTHYDGMRGNFSLCCCRSSYCNRATTEELFPRKEAMVAKNRRDSLADENSSIDNRPLFLLVATSILAIIY